MFCNILCFSHLAGLHSNTYTLIVFFGAIVMKTTSFIFGLSLLIFSGCSIGENPDKENFEVQHQEPSMEDAEQAMFRDQGK